MSRGIEQGRGAEKREFLRGGVARTEGFVGVPATAGRREIPLGDTKIESRK